MIPRDAVPSSFDTKTALATKSPVLADLKQGFFAKFIRNKLVSKSVPLKPKAPRRLQVVPAGTGITFAFAKGDYLVKTAASREDRQLCLDLRSKVFGTEYGADTAKERSGDAYDLIADHLMICRGDEVIGTYRMLWSAVTDDFYSQEEFILDDFLATPGSKVELSRACIAAEHRNGTVIALLWQGLYAYLHKTNADYLFGLSSIQCPEPARVLAVIAELGAKNTFARDHQIKPQATYDVSQNLLTAYSVGSIPQCQRHDVPALLRTYLKAGAQLGALPAYDPAFSCYDFFTILKRRDLNEAFIRRLDLQRPT